MKVAIDGPAGAGKSTIAREAAKRLGFVYIDTGAMYRAVAVYALENGLKFDENEFTREVLDKIKIEITYNDGELSVYLCGRDVSSRIREEDAGIGASDVARFPEVRKKLVEIQRALAKKNSVIMDGRDIGTYVLPDAEVKVFLTASVDVRAERRMKQLHQRGIPAEFETVKRDIEYRDKNDSERKFAPLKKAEDAILLDTSDMTMEQVIEKLIGIIEEAK